MAVFTLTTDTDNFSGSGNDVDHFVGVPLTISSVFYNGETGGFDTLNANGGNDHVYLGHGAVGTFDGGTETDTVHAYGTVDFFSTFTNFEIFNAASTSLDETVGIAASDLNPFSIIIGHDFGDGRVHLTLGIDDSIDFGARMDSLDMGVQVFVDASLSGSRTIEGTRHGDVFQIDGTHASSDISYFGNNGDDWFESDNDGGLAKFFGGANDDTFAIFRDGSLFDRVSLVDGGEDLDGLDEDTLICSNMTLSDGVDGNANTLDIEGIEVLDGTLITLDIDLLRSFDKVIYNTPSGGPPRLNVTNMSGTLIMSETANGNGVELIVDDPTGPVILKLTDKGDRFEVNHVEGEVSTFAGDDTVKITKVRVEGFGPFVKVDVGAGDDIVDLTCDFTPADKLDCEIDGGVDFDQLYLQLLNSDTTGTLDITEAQISNVEEFVFGEAHLLAGLAVFHEVQYATRMALDEEEWDERYMTFEFVGAGGTIDMTTFADKTDPDAFGFIVNGTALTSALKLTDSKRNDSIAGTAKNDTFVAGTGKDTVDGGGGKDTADYSKKTLKVEVTLKGAAETTVKVGTVIEDTLIRVENLIGGSKGDKLTGDGGANRLTGGKGSDTVKGGNGADQFVFNAKLGASNIDAITDFKANTDTLILDDAIFKGIGAKLDAKEFLAKSGATKAADKDDRIIYDTKTGKLYIDADGKSGAASVHFATLTTKPSGLDAADFAIV
jgi:hypothetical protein